MPLSEPLILRETDHGVIAQECTNKGRALLTKKNMEQLKKEQAKKEIIAAVEEYDNIIAFGFKKNGEAVTITATDDPIYDKLALVIQKFLEQLAREVEEECKREE